MELFYEEYALFNESQNKAWNKRNEKMYKKGMLDKITTYDNFLKYHSDEYFDFEQDPRYQRKVIVATKGANICDLL
jgi:hypothetical protein